MSQKKALGRITIIFYSIMFLIVWALFIAGQLSTWGHLAVVNGGYTGFEAFFYENLNLFVGVMFFIFILAISVYGGD